MHGSYVDEDVYLVYESEARDNLREMKTGVGFFGHTHIPCYWRLGKGEFRVGGEVVRRADLEVVLDRDAKYLINPGSVGQPRDGNPWHHT
jgi:predicted phosphodiesterase